MCMNAMMPSVFWLTGLSGAGKTTIGSLLTKELREEGYPVIFLDGDQLREVYQNQFSHDREQRLLAAHSYARLCKMLVEQHVHVVCATISLFHQVQAWNRVHINHYIEIFINVPLPVLIERDSKKIYSAGLKGEMNNIVGLDIQAELPHLPDITIQHSDQLCKEAVVKQIMDFYLQKRQSNKGKDAISR